MAGDIAALTYLPVETPAQVETLAALADEIWHECFAGLITTGQIDYMVERSLSPAVITALMHEADYRYWFIQAGGEPAGFLAVQPEGGRLLLSKLYLRAGLRGAGHGADALRFAEDQARALGCGCVWLTVNKGNARAIRAYRRAGYIQTRSQTADIGGGYVMDDHIFEKTL